MLRQRLQEKEEVAEFLPQSVDAIDAVEGIRTRAPRDSRAPVHLMGRVVIVRGLGSGAMDACSHACGTVASNGATPKMPRIASREMHFAFAKRSADRNETRRSCQLDGLSRSWVDLLLVFLSWTMALAWARMSRCAHEVKEIRMF